MSWNLCQIYRRIKEPKVVDFIDLIRHKMVASSINVRVCSPIMRYRWYFIDLIALSQRPPKWGAPGGLKCHYVPTSTSLVWTFSNHSKAPWNICRKTDSAPMKLVPWSLCRCTHWPRRAINLWEALWMPNCCNFRQLPSVQHELESIQKWLCSLSG